MRARCSPLYPIGDRIHPTRAHSSTANDAMQRTRIRAVGDRVGVCGAKTKLFGGRTCELIAGHHEPDTKRAIHRSGSITWFDVPPAEPKEREKIDRAA